MACNANEDAPVRCADCGWCGHAHELGANGECGSGEECQGRPAEITDHAEMIEAWEDTDGMVCGQQLADLGFLEPDPGTEAEALEEWGADTLWRLSEAGEAVRSTAKAARGEDR